jgi:hypothetical protein
MNMRRILSIICMCILVCATLAAADFWESKPVSEWSEKEATKLLTDSPWAVLMAIPLPNRGPVPTEDAGGGGRGGGGGGGSRGGGDGFGPGAQRIRITISWRSAIPMKQAAARQQAGKDGTIASEGLEALTQEDPTYLVGVQGLPPQYTRTGANTSLEAFLRREGKPPIGAIKAGVQMTRGGSLLVIAFPRADPITLSDGDVEFDVKIGQLDFKKKFKLKEMVYKGQLTL